MKFVQSVIHSSRVNKDLSIPAEGSVSSKNVGDKDSQIAFLNFTDLGLLMRRRIFALPVVGMVSL